MKTRAPAFASGWLAVTATFASSVAAQVDPLEPKSNATPETAQQKPDAESPQDPEATPRRTADPVLVTARKWGAESTRERGSGR